MGTFLVRVPMEQFKNDDAADFLFRHHVIYRRGWIIDEELAVEDYMVGFSLIRDREGFLRDMYRNSIVAHVDIIQE